MYMKKKQKKNLIFKGHCSTNTEIKENTRRNINKKKALKKTSNCLLEERD